jgi:glutamyl-Q tRNA(Asp) synthetase
LSSPVSQPVVGRFAPSPTGPLHFGSLIAAVGSYLQAKTRGGQWLLRIEDLDPPREVRGATDDILRTLERFGFQWDGAVLYQSTRSEAYVHALKQLGAQDLIYGCACTRRTLAGLPESACGEAVYPGHCRAKPPTAGALRLRVDGAVIAFHDAVQGKQRQTLAECCGDFIVQRADGLFAYQLAVVVDDAFQGVTEVVRGADLLQQTPRQIHLQHRLGLPTPDYAHLPLAVNTRGEKLSKQTHAAPLSEAVPALWRALDFLGQRPPVPLARATLAELWAWAHPHWRLARVPRELPAADAG